MALSTRLTDTGLGVRAELDDHDTQLAQIASPAEATDGQVWTADGAGSAAWENALAGAASISGEAGKNYKIVAGVINWDATAGAWAFISNEQHEPVNLDSVTADTTKIVVNYAGINATKVCAFLVTTDETFASVGYFVGASVGLSAANISIYSQFRPWNVSGKVSFNGSTWDVVSDGESYMSIGTVFNESTGLLAMSHTTVGAASANNIAVTGGSNLRPEITAASASGFTIRWRDAAGNIVLTPSTDMIAYVNRGGSKGGVLVDPTSSAAKYAGSNFWIIGLFEV